MSTCDICGNDCDKAELEKCDTCLNECSYYRNNAFSACLRPVWNSDELCLYHWALIQRLASMVGAGEVMPG